MSRIAFGIGASVVMRAVAAPAPADIGYALSARVGAHCAIGKVTQSHGRAPSVIVHSSCNANVFRLRFAGLDGAVPLRVEGNNAQTNLLADGVSIVPRRPGAQVTVLHFSEALPAAGPGSLTIEAF